MAARSSASTPRLPAKPPEVSFGHGCHVPALITSESQFHSLGFLSSRKIKQGPVSSLPHYRKRGLFRKLLIARQPRKSYPKMPLVR
jgi:hypothetical protein